MYDLIIFLVLISLGYGFGRMAEKRHYASIFRREEEFKDLLLVASKKIPPDMNFSGGSLVAGNVVVSVDYFKRFLAGLRSFFGGRIGSYETLIDRGRREAILRMKEEAARMGATMVFNIKLETSSISKGSKNTIGSIETLAYGTALIPGAVVGTQEVKAVRTPPPIPVLPTKNMGRLIVTHIPDRVRALVISELAAMGKAPKDRVAKLLSILPAVVSKKMEKDRADQLIARLGKTGVKATFDPLL